MPTNVLEFAKRLQSEPALQEYWTALLEAMETPPRRLSYDEFLEWADEDMLAEWENGEVIMSSPAVPACIARRRFAISGCASNGSGRRRPCA